MMRLTGIMFAVTALSMMTGCGDEESNSNGQSTGFNTQSTGRTACIPMVANPAAMPATMFPAGGNAAPVNANPAPASACAFGTICIETAPGQGVCAPACQANANCLGGEVCDQGYCRPASGSTNAGGNSCNGIKDGAGNCYPRCDENTPCVAPDTTCVARNIQTGEQIQICMPNSGLGMQGSGNIGTPVMNGAMGGSAGGGGGAQTACGNNVCEVGENIQNCAQDCGNTCGDGACTGSESPQTCPADCQAAPMGQTCTDLIQCLNQCGQADQACQQGCLQRFPRVVAQQYSAISLCALRNNCAPTDQNCVQTNCACELGVCQGTEQGPCEGGNPQGCGAIFECMQTCRDQQCANNCVQSASMEGQQLYTAFQNCAVMKGCVNQATGMLDANCVQTQCGTEFTGCLAN